MRLLESVGRLGKSLQESGIDFISCVDLSCCGLKDETCPAVVRLIQDMGGQSSGRYGAKGREGGGGGEGGDGVSG